jgi:hypothetical protein
MVQDGEKWRGTGLPEQWPVELPLAELCGPGRPKFLGNRGGSGATGTTKGELITQAGQPVKLRA